jgi:hypothetical protein
MAKVAEEPRSDLEAKHEKTISPFPVRILSSDPFLAESDYPV